jgi:hypothetical protein
MMVLYSPQLEREFRVPVQWPEPQRVTEIQQEFSRLLITPAAA